MPDPATIPAALRALADGLNPVAGMIWVDHDHQLQIAATLRAIAAEKEAATVKPDLTVAAEAEAAKLRALAEAATPGPWQVGSTRHPYSMVRLDGSLAEGEHVERWIQSVRIDPQAKAPHPIVVRSVGIAHPGEPPIPMVHIRPEDADYLAAVSPEVVLALLDTIDALRASLAAAEGAA